MPTIAIVGAGSGLGLSIAKTFGSHGFSVALVSRTQAKLDALAAELSDAGIEAAGFAADVMDTASVAAAFDRIKERFAPVDVLEYSPAPHNPVPGLSDPTPLEANRVSIQPQIDYYLYGGLAATEQALPRMIERDSGTIIYTTGGSSMDPLAGPAEFTATAIGSGALRAYALKLHRATAEPASTSPTCRSSPGSARRPRDAGRHHRPAVLGALQHPRRRRAAVRRFVTQRST